MMKQLLTTILALMMLLATAQTPDTTLVYFMGELGIGEVHEFDITNTSVTLRDGGTEPDSTSTTYRAKMEVLDRDDLAGTVSMKWTYTDLSLQQLGLEDELLQKLKDVAITEIIYETDLEGMFIGMYNHDDVRKKFAETMEFIAKESTSSEEEAKEMLMMLKPFLKGFMTDEGLEMIVLKDLSHVYYMHGFELPYPGQLVMNDVSLPALIGDEDIAAKSVMAIKSVDADKDVYTIEQRTDADPEALKDFFKGLMTMFGGGEDVEAEINKAKLSMSEVTRTRFSMKVGLPLEVEYVRNFKMGPFDSRTDRVRIVMVK